MRSKNVDDLAYRLITEYQELTNPEQRNDFEIQHYDEIKNFVLEHSNVKAFSIRHTICKNGQEGYKTILYRNDNGIIHNRIAYSSRATALMSIFYAVWQKDKFV